MMTYTMLDGSVIDLSELAKSEREFLAECLNAYRSDVSFPDFVNLVYRPGSPVFKGGRWVTKEIMATPLFKAVRDLEDRLGIRQGWVGPDPGDRPEIEPLVSDEEVSVTQAAEMKTVSRMAIVRACHEGRLVGRKVGNAWVISKRSLNRYEPMKSRIKSGRKAREKPDM